MTLCLIQMMCNFSSDYVCRYSIFLVSMAWIIFDFDLQDGFSCLCIYRPMYIFHHGGEMPASS